jgi:hypothetical protein
VGGAATSTGGSGGSVTACGSSVSVNRNPFNCQFAWGSGNNSATSYVDFVPSWMGSEANGRLNSWSTTGTNTNCNGCSLVRNLASSTAIPALYAYLIAFQACGQAGYCDCNTDPSGNLCTNGAQWIRDNYDIIVRAYGEYARALYATNPNKPVLWLLEGDISQYSNSGQQSGGALTWTQLGQLVSDITCAIKANQPNAIVAINHSYWLTESVTTSMFNAMPLNILDMVWMAGAATLNGLLTPATYTTVTYSFIHNLTGLPLYVGGQGASQPNWVSASATDLNLRIADGVIAADIDPVPSNAQSLISGLTLNSTCL